MTPYEMTLAALAETNPRVHAALAATRPNRAGNPAIGHIGFMWIGGDLEDLVRAAGMAHTRNQTEGWDADNIDDLVGYIRRHGSYRSTSHRAEVHRAIKAYCHCISTLEVDVDGAQP